MIKLTLVVACALIDTDNRVLIAQRPEGKGMASLRCAPSAPSARSISNAEQRIDAFRRRMQGTTW